MEILSFFRRDKFEVLMRDRKRGIEFTRMNGEYKSRKEAEEAIQRYLPFWPDKNFEFKVGIKEKGK